MLTPQEISGATTSEALARLGLRVNDAAYEDQKKANSDYLAATQRQEALMTTQNTLLTRQAVALEATAATQLNKQQQLWFDLYQANLKARKDPAVITSATADAVVRDIALDAVMMTNTIWPDVKAAMAAMDPDGGWA